MEKKLLNIKIEGIPYQVEEGLTIMEAAKKCGYHIPHLCTFENGLCSKGSCRVCLVEVTGARGLVASCVYPINEGMDIHINTPKANAARRTSVELLLSNHNKNCQQCAKNGHCELLLAAQQTGARENMYTGENSEDTIDEIGPGIIRDTSKCVLCGRCVETCKAIQGIGILGFQKRGFKTIVGPADNRLFVQSPCMQCGQCTLVCPTGALMEKDDISKVDDAIKAGKKVIVQTAPAVRAAIAEEFGEKIGTPGTGKMVAALHRLGFYRVFDVNFGADLTIMEEGTELLNRIKNNGVLPQITSCSPGWINYMENYYADLIPHISTCKSPHEMEGAIIRSYFAQKHNLDPKDIFVVSIMPCTAKKTECIRNTNASVNGLPDVDVVLTTRELARLIKRAGIDWKSLPEEQFDDDLLGKYSGAGVIFGVTGGVMEAALRTCKFLLTGQEAGFLDFKAVRGLKDVKEASIDINGKTLKVAIASGMAHAKVLLDEIRAGKSEYAFIEIMGCPGGCINGGGQPYVKECFLPNEKSNIRETYRKLRSKVLYSEDERQVIRQSHNNPDIQKLYKEYLGEPCGEKSHHLLHTSYNANRVRFPKK